MSIDSYESIQSEAKDAALRIGEISYTMKILNMNTSDDIESAYSHYRDLLIKKSETGLQKKTIKINNKTTFEAFELNLAYEFYKLQYLSIILFNNGEHTHVNSEEWILRQIRSGINAILKGTQFDFLPIFSSYLSIDKYILLLEQVRVLCRSKYESLGYLQTTWLDALEEFKCNCYDDCFWHLIQFFDDGKNGLDLFSKLVVAEKIVGLGVILMGIIKGNQEDSAMLITSRLLKHFKSTKIADGFYSFNATKHAPYSETDRKSVV